MKQQFVVESKGKPFCLYAGLLDEAHGQGLKHIDTELIQVPTADNQQTAIVRATVVTERGSFTGIGDASPANVARVMVTCLIRMAETRAKARALRDAVNVGMASIEELDEEQDQVPAAKAAPAASRPPAQGAPPAAAPAARLAAAATPGESISAAQKTMLTHLSAQLGEPPPRCDGWTKAHANEVAQALRSRIAETGNAIR